LDGFFWEAAALMSLGPCADALGVSVMMVFMFGVAQLPVMMALALHFPAVRIDLYNAAPLTVKDPATNGTAVAIPYKIDSKQEGYYMHGINVSGLFVLCSASFTFFVVLTMQLLDRGSNSHRHVESGPSVQDQEFTKQNLALTCDPAFRTWNQAFLASTLLVHVVIVVTVASPASMDLVLSTSALLYASLCSLLQPLDNFAEENEPGTSGAASMAAQSTMLLCMIFAGTILFLMTRIVVDDYLGKTQTLLLLACLDAFMLFGHLWDRVPMVQVCHSLQQPCLQLLKLSLTVFANDGRWF
jgi:hypothetical protein